MKDSVRYECIFAFQYPFELWMKSAPNPTQSTKSEHNPMQTKSHVH